MVMCLWFPKLHSHLQLLQESNSLSSVAWGQMEQDSRMHCVCWDLMHAQITEDFKLQLIGNKPAGKDQMEKQVRWSYSRNPLLKHEGRKTNAQYQNPAVLHLSHCSKAFGLLIPLLLWLRAIKDFKPMWKPL